MKKLKLRLSLPDWLEERKKINDAILSYEKMYDTDYFNQSTLSDESKDGWPEESKKMDDEEVEVESPPDNQRQQNDADQGQQNGQIRPWDPGIWLVEKIGLIFSSLTGFY